MRIFIDIGHPAHVHYFRNMIRIMEKRGHEFLVSARDKEVTHKLLDYYHIKYISRGKGKKSLAGKLAYLVLTDIRLSNIAYRWSPDLFVSFGSPYAAHVSKFLNKPHIGLTDTENATLGILSFAPFSKTVITPSSFMKSFGPKHIKIDAFFELCYLHPNYFEHDNSVRRVLNLSPEDKFVLFRFVSWNASHDIGQKGISDRTKIEMAELFHSKGYKVCISSESKIMPELQKYVINIAPEKIHSVIKEADMYIGEGATMATEAALLGTPSVYVNSLDAGVFHELMQHGLIYCFRNDNDLISEINKLISDLSLKHKHNQLSTTILREKVNITDFLIWFVENYPFSQEMVRKNPNIQYQLN